MTTEFEITSEENLAEHPAAADLNPKDELTVLKERAKLMNLKFSPNIGLDALRKKVADAIAGVREEEEPAVVETPVTQGAAKETKHQAFLRMSRELTAEATKLVRCRIANLNPSKNDLNGEFMSVENKYIGCVKRFIPFGEATEDGWHVPQVLVDHMKERKFLQIRTRKDKRTGEQVVETNWVPEFSIEILEPLTKEELAELARRQAAINGAA